MTTSGGTTFGRTLKAGVAGFLLALLLRVICRSCILREVIGEERLLRPLRSGTPIIVCLWHNRLAYMSWFIGRHVQRGGFDVSALISRSRDGELMARMVRWFKFKVVRGSTSSGGAVGLREMARRIRAGGSIATVGDGPRGPLYELKPGAVALAKLTGAPILPAAYATERAWILDSWDRFIVPKPFSGTAVAFGEPFHVDRRASDEEVEQAITELQGRLDALVGQAEALLESPAASPMQD